MRKKLITLCLLMPNYLFASNITHQGSAFPETPRFVIFTISSHAIKIRQLKEFRRFRVILRKEDIDDMGILQNKNPTLAKQLNTQYLHLPILQSSNNRFEKAPIHGELIINNRIQYVKITALNLSKETMTLTIKPFSVFQSLQPTQGPGQLIMDASCITARAACALGCQYVILQDRECLQRLRGE